MPAAAPRERAQRPLVDADEAYKEARHLSSSAAMHANSSRQSALARRSSGRRNCTTTSSPANAACARRNASRTRRRARFLSTARFAIRFAATTPSRAYRRPLRLAHAAKWALAATRLPRSAAPNSSRRRRRWRCGSENRAAPCGTAGINYAPSRARPLARRARITALPARVFMRTRYPCVRFLRVTEGW